MRRDVLDSCLVKAVSLQDGRQIHEGKLVCAYYEMLVHFDHLFYIKNSLSLHGFKCETVSSIAQCCVRLFVKYHVYFHTILISKTETKIFSILIQLSAVPLMEQ